MGRILQLLSLLVVGLFAAMWVWIGIKLLGFDPTAGDPTVGFTDAQATVAGFLASAVGAGTASVLGIEIQNAAQGSLGTRVNEAVNSSKLLAFGILVYAVVGTFVLVVWIFNSGEAPEMIGAFALGVLGWLSGAFAAVFRAT